MELGRSEGAPPAPEVSFPARRSAHCLGEVRTIQPARPTIHSRLSPAVPKPPPLLTFALAVRTAAMRRANAALQATQQPSDPVV